MSRMLATTPTADGFRMPGEFEPHQQCWMIWPERTDNWRLGAKPAQEAFTAVATAISHYEPVTMVASAKQYSKARAKLPQAVKVIKMANDDAWMRDAGATFVKHDQTGEVRGINWIFNAWGGLDAGLYFPWDSDQKIAVEMCSLEGLNYYSPELVLEGGSIHVDGQGTCIVTEECLLNKNRNPQLTKLAITNLLKEYLHLEKVIWIKQGIYLDETSGHVDNMLHFIAPGKLVVAWTDDRQDPQYRRSAQAYQTLAAETDAQGRSFEVIKLHLPAPVTITAEEASTVDQVAGTMPRQAGDRQAASYANFYLANNAAIVPIFGDQKFDQLAIETLQKAMPDRKVIPINSREILLGGGNIHCITQQQPTGKKA